jgi:hypothetical protein
MTNTDKNNTSAKRSQQQKAPQKQKQKQKAQIQKVVPDRVVTTLKEKLRGTKSTNSKYSEFVKDNLLKIKKIPMTSIRGNGFYAQRRSKGIRSMMRKLKDLALIIGTFGDEYILTNILFLTCTLRSNVSDYQSLDYTWELFKNKSSTFTKELKRIGKKEQKGLISGLQIIEHIQTFEAHLSSACHSHYILVLSKLIVCKKEIDENGEIIYVPSENVRSILYSKYEKAFGKQFTSLKGFNVRGSYAIDGLGGYITKELIKQHGNIEPILKKIDKHLNQTEPLTDDEIKTLYLHYFAHIYKMDMIRTSRGLSCVVDSEEIGKEDEKALDSYKELFTKNEADAEGFVERDSIVLSNQTLYKFMKRSEISPYSGFLQEGREKEVVSMLIAQARESRERITMLSNEALRL